jgi:uncharacterized membrane protein
MWEAIKNYYVTIGNKYHVDPVIFFGIHVVATPLFVLCVAWLIKKYKKKENISLPVIIAVVIFNAANIYLVLFGKDIPWWIFSIVSATTIISGFFSYKRIRQRITKS